MILSKKIGHHGDDVTIAKIDVARAFRNLRVDPADAVKLGMKWNNDIFIEKLCGIYSECLATSKKRQLTKKAFQSLLGKLLYVHKCATSPHLH